MHFENKLLVEDNARIIYRNFSGKASRFNREGDKNFSIVIEDPVFAQELAADGWNVKIRDPREEGGDPFCHVAVKVEWNEAYPRLDPVVYLRSGKNVRELTSEDVHILDDIQIESVDRIEIRARKWQDDRTGEWKIKAYLAKIGITQKVDNFRSMYGLDD